MCCPAETARLFFALEPDAEVRRQIGALQDSLDLPARRVAGPNLHITLAFLGEVSTSRIDELLTIGSQLSFPPCLLRFDRYGWFPRAGVVWLGSETPPGALITFQEALSARLAEGGFRVEIRPWLPHITLYRKMRKPCGKMDIGTVEWSIEGYCLMKSTLTGKGAVYDPVGRWLTAA